MARVYQGNEKTSCEDVHKMFPINIHNPDLIFWPFKLIILYCG